MNAIHPAIFGLWLSIFPGFHGLPAKVKLVSLEGSASPSKRRAVRWSL